MKVLIDIPKAFEADYNADRFAEFFQRCLADMGICCGNYEHETAEMMENAFAESKIYDPDKVVEQLEEFRPEMEQFGCGGILTDIIDVVKAGGADAEH